MKEFFKMMFASALGVFISIMFIGILSFFIFAGLLTSMSFTPAYDLKEQTIMKLNLDGAINERASSNPFGKLMSGSTKKDLGLNDILSSIEKAKENDHIKGIYIKAGSLGAGVATLEPIRKALVDFKASGKFVIAYGDVYSQGCYYLASAADKIILNPQGMVDLHGLAVNSEFYKGALDKLGVKMQVFKVGTFKSAVEPFIQDKMSDPNRLQVTSFLNDIWAHLLSNISESRNIPVEDLNRYADEYVAFSDPKTVLDYKLVDTLMYANQVEDLLKEMAGLEKKDDLRMAGVEDMKMVPKLSKNEEQNKIAVLYAEGSIVDNEDSNFYSSGSNIVGKKYASELIKLRDDENVKAIVFRVNSGGGSAYASEQIWNAVREAKKVKPVIVSMGDMAASGGYYISCEATKILAEPTTITGSIGIFGLIPEGEELTKRLGLTYDQVTTNKHSAFGASGIPFIGIPVKPFDDSEKLMIQAYVERGYDLFMTRCADGRSKTKAEIDSIGQGRVWTGNQAVSLGLVDKIGGLDDAVKIAAEAAGIEKYSLSDYPAQKDFFTELIEESFGGMKIYFSKQMLGADKFNQLKMLEELKSYDYRQAVVPYKINY